MLTFETIRKIVMEEKNSKTLSELPEDFFESSKVYIEKKSKLERDKESLWEMDTVKRWMMDLLEIRERKILSHAIFFVRSGVEPSNLTPTEKEFFDKIAELLRGFQNRQKSVIEGKPEKKITIALLQDVPRFVAINMKEFGPYKKGDIVSLPEENAIIMIKKGIAQEIVRPEPDAEQSKIEK